MIKRKPLVTTRALTGTAAAVYTVPTDLSAQVMGCTIHNPTATPITVSINYVPQAGTVGATNQVLKRTLQENESYPCPELVNHTLTGGMTIQAAGNSATIVISGVTFT